MKFSILSNMNLREEILKEHSKAPCNKIVQWIGSNQKRFDDLFELFLNDEYRVTQRAAWPLSYSVIAHPGLEDLQVSQHSGKPHVVGLWFPCQ